MAGEVTRFEGHIAKFMGDGVLAYFGWPRAHEDEAERAVQAGLAIAEAVSRLSTPAGEPLAARVGIATGLVVVGDLVGEGAAREEAVVGETPNLAARLQEAATPGAVVIADGTRRLLGEMFELRELGPTRLKGFAHPVSGLRSSASASPAAASKPGDRAGRCPWSGATRSWRSCSSGGGRLWPARARRCSWSARPASASPGWSRPRSTRLSGASTSRSATSARPFTPVRRFGRWPSSSATPRALLPADTEAAKLDKLEALLRQGVEDVEEAVPLISELLGIDAVARYPAVDLTPQQRRARTLAVLIEQLLGLSRRRPVLMVVEDAHWIDPTTLEFLGQALDRIAGARALLLLTSRPDNQPALGGHPHVTRLTLNRLGRGPTEAIVARLTGGRSLPPEMLAEIAARTDGVPLFIEELTKAVLEAAGTAVPASLHASLMARLDRVAGVKEVAQVAACIGREFAYPLLAAVSPSPEAELQTALDRLAAAELVFSRGSPPEASYTFKHALVRDAAHDSLLKTQRQQLHARIASVLEQSFPETVGAEPEVLAQHCTEAGLIERAVEYWQRAGQQALARSATAEAVAQLTKGLDLLAGLPDGAERRRRELGLQLGLGPALIAAKGFAALETGRAYARACELCRELGDTRKLIPALYGQSVVHWQRAELAAAHEVARELLPLAQEQGDAAAEVVGHRILGAYLFQLGRLAEGRAHSESGLALYDPVRDRSSRFVYAVDSRVVCLLWLSQALFALGYPEQARVRQGEALASARELAHPNTIAQSLFCGWTLHQLLRDGREAQEQAEALIALATEHGLPLWLATGVVVRGWALAASGQAKEGIAVIRLGLADYRATGSELFSPYFLALLADAHGRAGQTVTGLRLTADALDQVERTGVRWNEAELHRLRGELLLALPEPDQSEAESCFRQALAVAREQDAKMWELRAATSLVGCGPARASAPWRMTSSHRSTAGSPRASRPPIYGTPRLCSTSYGERTRPNRVRCHWRSMLLLWHRRRRK